MAAFLHGSIALFVAIYREGMHRNRKTTVVMYHYVRRLKDSRFPLIKGLTVEKFLRQLDHIQANYVPVTVEQLLNVAKSPDEELPENAILLTFDDGYSDHFENVFPILHERGIQGAFFPSAKPVLENSVLDVNKIHFILASVPNVDGLLDQVFRIMSEFDEQYSFKSKETYLANLKGEHRYDTPEVILIKRLLQRELPEAARLEIVHRLFAKYVTSDEQAFSRELYMSAEQIVEMRREGMHIGCHGYAHVWLNHIPVEMQVDEINRSLDFLRNLGVSENDWTICYPYGGFDESLLKVLESRRCQMGFSVEPRIADLNMDQKLTLPRIDTNDLPS